MRRIAVVLFASLLLAPGLWANQGIEGNTIKLGGFMPLSGVVGFIGDGVRIGIATYVKYFNAELSKDFGGKQLDFTALDDAFVAEKAVQAVKDLVENRKVFALMGSVGTPGVVGTFDYIVKKGIPYVYQGSGVTVLYRPPQRNVFPVQPAYIYEGRVMVKFIADFLQKKKIVLIYQNDEAGEGVIAGIEEMLPTYTRKGVVVLDKIPVAMTETDFTSVINRVKNLNPDVVIAFAFGGRAIGIVRTAREAGMDLKKTPFLTTYVNSDPIMFKLAGNLWNDVYVGAWARPTGGDYYKNFMRVWKQYSGQKLDPSPYNIAGWIAAETFVEGLKRTLKKFGNLTWDNYIKAMETFGEKGGWSEGMAYKLAYKPFNAKDPNCRNPQAYLYFIVGVKKEYQMYKKADKLEDLYIPAY